MTQGDLLNLGLTEKGCRERQERLRHSLAGAEIDAAVLTEPVHAMYFCNHWDLPVLSSAVVIPADGPSVLVTASREDGDRYADRVLGYEANKLSTLVDDQQAAALEPVLSVFENFQRLGVDSPNRPWILRGHELVDLNPTLRGMRRGKYPDELALIRHSVAGLEAGYAAVREAPLPEMTELEVFSLFHAAAVEAVGEPLAGLLGDFRGGSPGGPPRDRRLQWGELMPLDAGAVYRGYHADLCRTFAVGGQPSPGQREAAALVREALELVEETIRPGVSCRALYEQVRCMLDGAYYGWSFPHHLGHGIGLSAHEAPRLNPNWDDFFQVGDVFTAEPGVYDVDLRGGVRLEHDYVVTDDGVERLSSYPTDL